DRLGELDLADVTGELDARAHGRPAGMPILSPALRCRALWRLAQLLLELLGVAPSLAHAIALLLNLARPFLNALFGNLFVVEDHQLANRAVAGVETIPELDDVAGDERRSRDRFDDRELAPLDAPGDFHFAFAREQWHRAHFAQVHPDR